MSKRFSILLVVLTVISGLIGGAITGRIFTPKVAKVLTVEELMVVDKSGKLRMKLGKGDVNKNRYGLAIYDNSNDIGAMMSVDESGGIVSVGGKNSHVFMSVDKSVDESGGTVSVAGKDGKIRAFMMVDESGGTVGVGGKDGKTGAKMNVSESGGRINVYGKGSNIERASMQVNEYGYGAIGLWDKDGYKLR